jgi:hydroxypyruvate isomerase
MKRRQLIGTLASGVVGSQLGKAYNSKKIEQFLNRDFSSRKEELKGNINHSVCRWCYNGLTLEALADGAKEMGLSSVELLNPNEWDIVLNKGLKCAISFGSPLGITKGFNDPQYHEQLRSDIIPIIHQAAEKGVSQIICFSGNRGNISDEEGLENCAQGLEAVVKEAQKYDIMITMELLNSRVNHPDYMCDHTEWGVALVDKLGSSNFKLLYDIYHMQIMEGDIIATIKKYHEYISHYHTGGVPGRNEINETQELYYPAIMRAIAESDYEGFVGQEFIPTRDLVLDSLQEGVHICDI